MNKNLEEDLIQSWGYYRGRLRNVYSRYDKLEPEPLWGIKQEGLSITRIANVAASGFHTPIPNRLMAPFFDDVCDTGHKNAARSETLFEFMRLVQSSPKIVVDEIRDQISAGLGGLSQEAADKITMMVKIVDDSVTDYCKQILDTKVWGFPSTGGVGIPAAVFWECDDGKETTPVEERKVTSSDLNNVSGKHAYLAMIRDDSTSIWKGRERPALVMTRGIWRPDEASGKSFRECFAVDIVDNLAVGYRNVLTGTGMSGGSDNEMFENPANYDRLQSPKLVGIFRSGMNVLFNLCVLIQHAVDEGYIDGSEPWVNLFINMAEAVKHELKPENNPNALLEIGGWS